VPETRPIPLNALAPGPAPAAHGRAPAHPWSGRQVRDSFNGIPSILYYTRAAHVLGLWKSERLLIERFLPDPSVHVLEAGCGAGRVTLGLWNLGYRRITAFDFAGELLDQARSLARQQGAGGIVFRRADATTVRRSSLGIAAGAPLDGALFMFNGLMQIPGRRNRRAALSRLAELVRPGAPIVFTSHDRDASQEERERWRFEAALWAAGRQDPSLSDFGDRHFTDESGDVFIHIPDRAEILADLDATGWHPHFDAMRTEIARESAAVTQFSDNCRFWVALRRA
jgi:SAM-dependent methyltransferase